MARGCPGGRPGWDPAWLTCPPALPQLRPTALSAPCFPSLLPEPARGGGGAQELGAREKYREKGTEKEKKRVRDKKWMRLKEAGNRNRQTEREEMKSERSRAWSRVVP